MRNREVEVIVVPTPRIVDCKYEPFTTLWRGSYEGADVRLRASQMLAEKHPTAQIYVVGGYCLNRQGGLLARAEVMAREIRRNCTEPWRVKAVNCLPCTYHGFRTLFLQYGAALSERRIVVVTNCYHTERASWMWRRAADKIRGIGLPTMLSAESVTHYRPRERFAVFYQQQLERERRGVASLRAGKYVESCLSNIELLKLLWEADLQDVLMLPKEKRMLQRRLPVSTYG